MPAPVRHRSLPAASALGGRLLGLVLGLSGLLSLVGLTPSGHPAEVLLRLGVAVGGLSLSVALWGGQGAAHPAQDLPLPESLPPDGHLWLRLLPVLGALGFLVLLLAAIWSQYRAV